MTLEEAISYLKKGVKFSAVPGQKHIDPTLFSALEKDEYENALKTLNTSIKNGEMTEAQAKERLGLI